MPKKKPKPQRPELTDRQRECLNVIRDYIAEQGWAPTVREIGEDLGINSPNGVMAHLRALEEKGYIVRGEHGESRAMRVV